MSPLAMHCRYMLSYYCLLMNSLLVPMVLVPCTCMLCWPLTWPLNCTFHRWVLHHQTTNCNCMPHQKHNMFRWYMALAQCALLNPRRLNNTQVTRYNVPQKRNNIHFHHMAFAQCALLNPHRLNNAQVTRYNACYHPDNNIDSHHILNTCRRDSCNIRHYTSLISPDTYRRWHRNCRHNTVCRNMSWLCHMYMLRLMGTLHYHCTRPNTIYSI